MSSRASAYVTDVVKDGKVVRKPVNPAYIASTRRLETEEERRARKERKRREKEARKAAKAEQAAHRTPEGTCQVLGMDRREARPRGTKPRPWR